MLVGSSAGGSAARLTQGSFSTPLSRRFTIATPCPAAGLSITAIAAWQYVSIKYTERLAEAGLEPSVGSVGDSYDNALAETINGLYKAEVIHRRGPWRSMDTVEYATLEWVDWFNNRRLLEPHGNIAPAEARAASQAPWNTPPPPSLKPPTTPAWRDSLSARDSSQLPPGVPGAVQPIRASG